MPIPTNVVTVGDYRSLAEELAQHVCRVTVHVHRWRGRYLLPGATVDINGLQLVAGESVSTPALRVIPQTWDRRLAQVESRLRSVASRYTIPIQSYQSMPTAGGDTTVVKRLLTDDKIIPQARVEGVRRQFHELVEEQWTPLVNEFLAALPEILAQFQEKQPRQWELVKDHLPAGADAVRGLFAAHIAVLPLGISVDDLTVEALERGAGTFLDGVRQSLINETVGRLVDATQDLQARIAAKEVVRSSQVQSVTDALASFRSFAQALGPTPERLEQLLNDTDRLLMTVDIKDINSSSRHNIGNVAQHVGNTLAQLAGQARDAFLSPGTSNQRRLLVD